ncbi:hypothetical protein HK405_012409 [Cladochytrium tenue]|nr:hypothetical protein HK405_012409 [Cladochytrium tenue]
MPKRKKPTRDVGGDDGSPCPDGATETTATTLAVDADAHPDDFTASLNNYHSLPAAARRDLAAARAVRGVFFGVEPSSSSRSLCKGCRRPIAAGTLRFRHVVCGRNCCSEKRTGVRDACGRWHVDCLLEAQVSLVVEGGRRKKSVAVLHLFPAPVAAPVANFGLAVRRD